MKKKLFNISKIAIPLLLGLYLIYYSYSQFSVQQLEDIEYLFATANYSYILLAMLLGLISDFLRAYRWNFLLIPLGHHVKLSNSIMAVGAAYLINLIVPRGGEVTRAVIVKKYDNVPIDHGFGTIIAERAVDFIVLLLLIFVTLSIQFDVLKEFLSEYVSFEKFLFLGVVLFFLLAVAFLFFKKSKNQFILKIKKFIEGIIEGFLSIFKSEKKAQFLFLTLLIWALYILMFYVTIFAIPGTDEITLSSMITTFVAGSIVMAFTNSGFGTFPFVIAEILLLFGVEITTGTAFGWLAWISQTVLVIIYGLLSLLLLPVFNRNK